MSQLFPFAEDTSTPTPIVYNDIVIQEPFPGIILNGQEAGAVYAEAPREVNGCVWFALNATWNPNTARWEQDSPANAALPAYGLELCKNGAINWNYALASGTPGNALTWVTLFTVDAVGQVTFAPATFTLNTQVAQTVDATWNAGSSALMTAMLLDVTDTSSSVNSVLQKFVVNGTTVWEVNKSGVLVVGDISGAVITPTPYSHLTNGVGIGSIGVAPNGTIALSHGDYVDLGNTQTISGQKKLALMLALIFGASGVEVNSDNAGNLVLSCGASYVNGSGWTAQQGSAVVLVIEPNGLNVCINSGLTVGVVFTPTPVIIMDSTGEVIFTEDITLDETLTVVGATVLAGLTAGATTLASLTVTADETIDGNLTVDGNATIDGTLTLVHTPTFPQMPIGGTLLGHGNGGNPTIALPNYGTWWIEVLYGIATSSNSNYSATLSVTAGTVTGFGSNADGTTSFNADKTITVYGTGSAAGNQTVTFDLTVSGTGLEPSPAQPWTVRATRTA